MEENISTMQDTGAEGVDTTTATDAAAADQADGFLAGFDDADGAAAADQPTDSADDGADTDPDAAADQPTGEGTGEADAEGAQGAQSDTDDGADDAGAGKDAPAKAAPKTWEIKHMGETMTVSEEQITPELLQKAYDYDRVRGKYDEAKPVMDVFSKLAQRAGMSVSDYAKSIRTETKKAEGMDEAQARRAVELEDREAAIAAIEQREQAQRQAATARDARISADLAEFARAFPQVHEQAKTDPKGAIPQSVWDEVNAGMSLTAAYSRYAVAQAEASAAAKVAEAEGRAKADGKNRANAARSTGSMKSAGSDTKVEDDFLKAFDG